MSEDEKNQLGKTLWSIADRLRGSMNADDFRDYMLGFIFIYHLSCRFEEAVLNLTKSSYQSIPQDKYDQLKNRITQKLGYFMLPQHLWSHLVSLARNQDTDNIRTSIQATFDALQSHHISEDHSQTLQGLFADIDLSTEKLGKTPTQRGATLCHIIIEIDNGLKNLPINTHDSLGDAYEYLIAQFASGSGKKAGEFYTPHSISSLLAKIVSTDCQNPTKTRPNLGKVLDFACGSGSLLLTLLDEMDHNIDEIWGQEKNHTTYNLARMNMFLRKHQGDKFKIFHGDTLSNDWDELNTNPANSPKFDAIVANPPFSLKWDPTDTTSQDARFASYGLAPKSSADFAFLLHGFYCLDKGGIMAIILPHGVLFRGGTEAKIRTKLIQDGNIDAIIGLPANLFYSTSIAVSIIVLKKCHNQRDHILFIDASQEFEKGKKQNQLLPEHIDKMMHAYQNRTTQDRYSRLVPISEIQENDYNLNISRYITTSEQEASIDFTAVQQQISQTQADIKQSKATVNEYLHELNLPPLE